MPLSGVTAPGAGLISTRGPVHLDRRATTSARSARSANATLGCDLSCRHASSHGIVSEEVGPISISIDNGIEAIAVVVVVAAAAPAFEELLLEAEVELPHTDCPQSAGFPQHPPVVAPRDADMLLVPATCATPAPVAVAAARPGQFSHCDVHATELLIAAQKALPNASSAQARQLDGSPEQEAVRGRLDP